MVAAREKRKDKDHSNGAPGQRAPIVGTAMSATFHGNMS